MNKKIFLSIFTALLSISLVTSTHRAFAADSKILFEVDCNTLNKDVSIGFQSDPADSANGEEIIAFELTLHLEATTGSLLSDLANAKFEPNSSYTNLIVAQNTSKDVGNIRELKIAGGFTQQSGLNDVSNLISITGVNQKAYKITVEDGKLFPKSGGDDIYTDTAPKKSFSVDPSSCQSTQTNTNTQTASTNIENIVIENFVFTPTEINVEVGDTVIWTNNDSTKHTVTSVAAGGLNSGELAPGESYQKTFTESGTFEYKCSIHPSMTGRVVVAATATSSPSTTPATTTSTQATSAELSIALTSSVQNANPGDEVIVTAVISNMSGSIDWSQTEGNRIQPDIKNETTSATETKSTLTFTMPTPATNVTLRLKVSDKTETITIKGADTATAAAANTSDSTTTTTDNTGNDSSQTASLQERLEQRRAEQEATANPSIEIQSPTGTLHAAAGSGLTRSGPEHTSALLFASALIALAYRKKKRLFESI
jgi:plastocyanin